MSGKFRICSAAIISLTLVFSSVLAFTKNRSVPDEELNGIKNGLRINGYLFTVLGPTELKGLREKAKADYYFYQGRLADVIRHYELASKYLPDEADIYYRLGTVYRDLSVFNTAASYYRVAAQKYMLNANLGKTQRNRYRSMIYEGICLEKSSEINDNHKKAQSMLALLQQDEKIIIKDYPEVTNDLRIFNETVNGQTRVDVIK